MFSFPTIIAFSFGEEPYHTFAGRLQAQCLHYGYPHSIDIDADLADYTDYMVEGLHPRHQIYRVIPSFILSKLNELGSVLYLHCDFRIQQEIPTKAWDGLDIGLQKRWKYAVERSNFPMLAAPIYARNNENARRFLRLYESLCLNVDTDRGEHVFLRFLWKYLERDRSLRKGYFDPHIATLQKDAENVPILGHKSD